MSRFRIFRRLRQRNTVDQGSGLDKMVFGGLRFHPSDLEDHVSEGSHPQTNRTGNPSRIGQMAATAATVSEDGQAVFGALLDGILPPPSAGTDGSEAAWVAEAVERAYYTVHLVAELERIGPSLAGRRPGAQEERKVAAGLAALLRSLAVGGADDILPCAGALGAAVLSMVRLFGPAAGQPSVRGRIGQIWMPAPKRRAIVLAACGLVASAIRHGFGGRGCGCIEVTLCRTGPSKARLGVAAGFSIPGSQRQNTGAAANMADFLESALVYRSFEGGGTIAEITFPVRHLEGRNDDRTELSWANGGMVPSADFVHGLLA
jgi:hypothetical protein